ncbi:putative Ras GTPase-activating protein-binding protein [Helianthus annuus]|nr:putative Ras GTPase-activating protein-binding protein [Helianthus annuus]
MYLVVYMASQAASPAAVLPSAQVVGNAFVDQYYHILHQSPELVHKFYQDSSILSRPDTNGLMSSVTTMQLMAICPYMLDSLLPFYVIILLLESKSFLGT